MARTTWRTFAAACATTAIVTGPLALHATAASAPPPDGTAATPPAVEKAPPGVLRAMQRDLGLSTRDATERLAFQSDAASAEVTLEAKLGDEFAGVWVDPEENTLYVGVVADSDRRAASADRRAASAAGARVVAVEHTLDELETWKSRLDAELADETDAIPSWYVDVTTNAVVVNAHADALDEAAELVEAAGVPAGAVEIVTTTESPRTFIDVVGGNAYYMSGGGRCSVGFAVQGGFVTAGHCGQTGTTTTSPNGTFRGSSFPGRDYGWVQVGAGNTLVGAVNNYSGGRVQVAGSTAAPVGAAVCRSGSTTGWRCGTIQAYNSSVTYPQGTVTGLIRTNVCAEPGDSGGSLLAGNQAQGVTSGGSGNCRTGGTTYFQPVNPILSAYGLTLITSGGGGGNPEPPPAGCTGYASTFTGTLSSGATAAQPNGSYYTTTRSGTHRGCLSGPSGADFDLYLQKWSGSQWVSVAQSTAPGSSETVTYNGTSGYYRYVVHAYSGSGSYTLGATAP
ncbi:S1 family peptidase [Oerskovia flava]|uniref:S1 family peptidase n=1 Tax=Oerskovia flava TaxID=2986422 RepID=UPI00223FECE6|nr:S1 family peptidase [Oerskovia sp. JB1-3-2]